MTDKERDDKIDKIYDVMLRLEPMVKDHQITLYGNGKPGLKEDMAVQKINYANCPARLSATMQGKGLTIAYIMMVIGLASLVASVVVAFVK